MAAHALLIGTRGWLHPAWDGVFYPPELPPEWRFCFYSNRLRSVLVPAELWPQVTPADVAQWAADSDPLFRFVLELPVDVWAAPAATVARLCETLDPIGAQIAGWSLAVPADTAPAALDALLTLLTPRYPVCVDLAPLPPPALAEVVDHHGAGRAWRVGDGTGPAAGGRFLVSRMTAGDPRALRRAIEALVTWRGTDRTAALFLDAPTAGAPALAEQARTLAELMGA
jgi:hypothetical protein